MTRDELLSKCYDYGPSRGWVPRVEQALNELCELGLEGLRVMQVKEKFGGLRIYTNGVNDDVNRIIDAAARDCRDICEDCGAPAQECEIRGWVSTLCKECEQKDRERGTR